jgi:large subunit ribosomal protein L4
MEANLYNQKGKSVGSIELSPAIFSARWNADLVHQVVVGMQSNERDPIAHAKMRGEVSGGGKKPWRQKGTGRARHGSTRSPIWVGGGTTHGPRNDRNWKKRIPSGMKNAALLALLSKKYAESEIIFVDTIELAEAKTREAKTVLEALSTVKGFESLSSKKNNAALIIVPKKTAELRRGFDNFGNIELDEVRNLNPLSLATKRFVIIVDPKASLPVIETRVSAKRRNAVEVESTVAETPVAKKSARAKK